MKIKFIPSRLIALALWSFAHCPIAHAVVTDPFGYFPGGNTAEGQKALLSVALGTYNTAIGFDSLKLDFAGDFNTGIGAGTLLANNADQNTASGAGALLSNTSGFGNTANGAFALFSNAGGAGNTAAGTLALFSNVSGDNNTADGGSALFHNIDGINNTATGVSALVQNTSGSHNTATGLAALASNIDGNDNTAIGLGALGSNTTGGSNTALGSGAGSNLTTGDNNINIANAGVAAESSTIRVGTVGTQTATYVAGIFGATVTDGAPVIVDTNGHLGTVVSSARFKDEIKPMGKASAVILALKPVTFRYTKERDPKRIPQFGLVAEDVEKTDPDLVIRDRDGKPYTVRYDAVNAMLLNEFLREHNASLEERHRVEKLEATVAGLLATVKEQAAKIQKMSAHIQMDQRATNVALSRP